MRSARTRTIRRGSARLGLATALLLLTSCAKEGISPQGQDVHQLFGIIMILAVPIFLAVEGVLLWCVVRYRKRTDEPAPQTVGGGRSLGVFFAIPAVIVAILFPFGETALMRIERHETPQVQIRVEGFQWEWTFLYLEEGIFVSGKTLVKPAEMVLPVDEPVEITVTSRDVIHSFFVPDLLFKRDAIPGRTSTFEFTPTQIGTFPAQCAEFCGLWHSKMTFDVKVVSSLDYQAWIEQQREAAQSITCKSGGTTLSLVAHDISWNQFCLAVPGDAPFTVNVDNQDSGIEHNFSIYDSFFQKQTFFTSPKITGPTTESLDVQGLPSGRYYFQCDVHGPAMSGAFVVE
ncbi:MAG: cytochrome c oxidase subunit II [Actinomycetota bacterium]